MLTMLILLTVLRVLTLFREGSGYQIALIFGNKPKAGEGVIFTVNTAYIVDTVKGVDTVESVTLLTLFA